jgi:hypothetical protein
MWGVALKTALNANDLETARELLKQGIPLFMCVVLLKLLFSPFPPLPPSPKRKKLQ